MEKNPNSKTSYLRELNPKNDCRFILQSKISALLRGTTSKNNGDFYYLNCLHCFRARIKIDLHKTVSENKDFCNVIMPSANTKTLKFN